MDIQLLIGLALLLGGVLGVAVDWMLLEVDREQAKLLALLAERRRRQQLQRTPARSFEDQIAFEMGCVIESIRQEDEKRRVEAV